MSSKRFLVFGAALIYLLLDASEVYAWGPVTHVRLAGDVLANLQYLPAAIAAILARYGSAYLYGTLAADVVFAKRLSRIKQFCHHWSTGFRILDTASDDRERAFAYGYLSHLAADTVAHGKFVPYHVLLHRTSVNFGHLYWEMRADAAAGDPARRALVRALAEPHDSHHRTLAKVLTETLLPYSMNRAVFDRLNRLAARRGYHQSVNAWGRVSRRDLCPVTLDAYHAESLDRTFSLLHEGARSALLSEDPSGAAALLFAAAHRRDSKRRLRRGLPMHHRTLEAAAGHAPSHRR